MVSFNPSVNPFADFLEETPEAAYYSYINPSGRTPRYRNYWERQFSNIYNRYLGTLGTRARAGKTPTGSFNQFLSDFDFPATYLNDVSYEQRNPEFNAFVPSLRWLIR